MPVQPKCDARIAVPPLRLHNCNRRAAVDEFAKKRKRYCSPNTPGIELADSMVRRINLQLRYFLNREIEFLLAQAVRPLRSRSRVERQERKS
jgi:hypothetical protein